MLGNTSPEPGPGQGPTRLKLIMPNSASQSSPVSNPSDLHASTGKEPSGSPPRPSYSPVTPTLPQASLAGQTAETIEPPPEPWMDEPTPLPLSLDDNADAIALRAAISVLQLQRQQALRDVRDLDRMKQAALQEPEAFVRDLKAGKLSRQPHPGVDVDVSDASDDEVGHQDPMTSRKFGTFPTAQNIVRCPPIEWSKYHIAGEPLDRLHEVQRVYPGFDEEVQDSYERPQPHVIAQPYRPFADRFESARTAHAKEEDHA